MVLAYIYSFKVCRIRLRGTYSQYNNSSLAVVSIVGGRKALLPSCPSSCNASVKINCYGFHFYCMPARSLLLNVINAVGAPAYNKVFVMSSFQLYILVLLGFTFPPHRWVTIYLSACSLALCGSILKCTHYTFAAFSTVTKCLCPSSDFILTIGLLIYLPVRFM